MKAKTNVLIALRNILKHNSTRLTPIFTSNGSANQVGDNLEYFEINRSMPMPIVAAKIIALSQPLRFFARFRLAICPHGREMILLSVSVVRMA